MLEENIRYQLLQKICGENVCRTKAFRANMEKFGQSIIFIPKCCLLLHLCL